VTKLGLYVPRIAPEHLIPDELGKAYEPRERWLPREEYEALVRALTPVPPGKLQIVAEEKRKRAPRENRADYVIAWCNLGVRKEELSTIQPADYDAARRELRVRGTKTKGADRLIPVNDAAAEVLERRCHNAKPFPSWANCTKKLAETCAKLRLAPVTPNDFRRTFCSWLCQAGVPERICAELLGHGSTVMVRAVYGHLDRASLQRAVALL
jgi:integrase